MRITSAISNATKSDDWRPLLVSMTTLGNAAFSRPSKPLQRLGIDLGRIFQGNRVGQHVKAGAVPRHRPLEQGQVQAVEALHAR